MLCEDRFRETYKRDPEGIEFCPYRICPIGAHVDHQLGHITGLAIDSGIHIAYRPKTNGVVELSSLQFDKRAQWHVKSTPEKKQGDWADYLRGATIALSKLYPLNIGMSGVIEGSMPIGGLSSSAAVTVSFISALCKVNGIKLTPLEMVNTALEAEFNYVGVSVGKLDQSCEVYSRKGQLLHLDTLDDSYELIPYKETSKPFEIAIFFSGLERNLAGSKYNMRVDECRSAAYALMAYAGMDYGKFKETYFRNVPREVYDEFGGRLPESWRKRAEHWYSEQERVARGAEAWRNGNIEEYGRLSFESGHSSIYNWETGSPELKTIYEIMLHTDGIYGGRFSGAGFKGCCMALIDPSFKESILAKVEKEYLEAFPGMKGRFRSYICQSADGVTL